MPVINKGEIKMDKFFVNIERNEIVWMYRIHDPFIGDKFVMNLFDLNCLNNAVHRTKVGDTIDASKAFDMIETECRQFLVDIGSDAYQYCKKKFTSNPTAIGTTKETIDTIQLYFEAKDLISQYCADEFDERADFSDITKIGVAYTTTADDVHEIQVYVNLAEHQTETYLDGECIDIQKSEDLKDYVANQLAWLSFDDLTYIPGLIID